MPFLHLAVPSPCQPGKTDASHPAPCKTTAHPPPLPVPIPHVSAPHARPARLVPRPLPASVMAASNSSRRLAFTPRMRSSSAESTGHPRSSHTYEYSGAASAQKMGTAEKQMNRPPRTAALRIHVLHVPACGNAVSPGSHGPHLQQGSIRHGPTMLLDERQDLILQLDRVPRRQTLRAVQELLHRTGRVGRGRMRTNTHRTLLPPHQLTSLPQIVHPTPSSQSHLLC